MNQTNRADAAQKYLEAVGFIEPDWVNQPLHEKSTKLLPRMRFVNNLGVWELYDARGSRVLGNDIESTYFRWIQRELERNANEDYNDMPAYDRLVSQRSMVRTLVATGAGLLIIALAAFLCLGFR